MKTKIYALLFLATAWLGAHAAKPMPTRSIELNAATTAEPSEVRANTRISTVTSKPLAIYGMRFQLTPAMPEEMAQEFLQKKGAELLGLDQAALQQLRYFVTSTGPAGYTIRLRQFVQNIPVGNHELTLHLNNQLQVTAIFNSFRYGLPTQFAEPSISLQTAIQKAIAHMRISEVTTTSTQLEILPLHKNSRLAYKITIRTPQILGHWEVYIDAQNGSVLKCADAAAYYNKPNSSQPQQPTQTEFVNGTGKAFIPNPLSSAMANYGGGYVDGNDANTTELTAELKTVTLNNITFDGTNYLLKGPRVEILDFDPPATGLFAQPTSTFNFTRADQGFEPTNVYYNLETALSYINVTLGINCIPYQHNGIVQYDPHGAYGDDNSYYSNGQLSFGEGCVDDAEDSDVIWHELGHGIHDWITSGGLSQVDGLSEGCGDYWAQSYHRSVSNLTSSAPQYQWVFHWDGHNTCWGGRQTNYGAHYPEGLVGQIHTDGQIWASCLMAIYDEIGRAQMDKAFLEGLRMTNSSSSQDDAANAVYQAAQDMNYSQAHIESIRSHFLSCGYSMPGVPITELSSSTQLVCLDESTSVQFNDLSQGEPVSWFWQFEGGTPATSTLQNPTVTYSAAGTYDVKLRTTNAFGIDSVTLNNYIEVVSGQQCPGCAEFIATDLPITISTGAPSTITSTLVINNPLYNGLTLTDVNVLGIQGTHTYVSDLIITLTAPNGTQVVLMDTPCQNQDNFNISFDDGAASASLPCPPVGGGTYRPASPLAVLNGSPVNGTWKLSVEDTYQEDGGSLTNWRLELCAKNLTSPSAVSDALQVSWGVAPNPAQGGFYVRINDRIPAQATLTLYNVLGQPVWATDRVLPETYIHTLSEGLYFVVLSSEGKKAVQQLTVIR